MSAATVVVMQAYVRVDPSNMVVERADVAAPTPGRDEVLVAVNAFGVGIHDRYFIPTDVDFPYTIGTEGAGLVVEVGSAVNGVAIGDRVMVSTGLAPKGGPWAQLVVAEPGRLIAVPESMDLVTAAGIPIAGKTAVETMHALDLRAGETLFVAGASGAIGTLVVQMASQRGVRVVGSASSRNHDHLRAMGAEHAVDYSDPGWPDEVRRWSGGGVDAALAIQPGTPPSSRDVVRDGGRVITVSGDPCPSDRGIAVAQFDHRTDAGDEMAALVDDICADRIHLVIEHVYPFDEALTALEKTETRHARGKLVVTVD
jgi:NADPH:quinone reductase-like Zn-dependent oxidoreductase